MVSLEPRHLINLDVYLWSVGILGENGWKKDITNFGREILKPCSEFSSSKEEITKLII